MDHCEALQHLWGTYVRLNTFWKTSALSGKSSTLRILTPQSRAQEIEFSPVFCTTRTQAWDLSFTGQIDSHKASVQKQATGGNRLCIFFPAGAGGNRAELVAPIEASDITVVVQRSPWCRGEMGERWYP